MEDLITKTAQMKLVHVKLAISLILKFIAIYIATLQKSR